jgi:hypothetical protein
MNHNTVDYWSSETFCFQYILYTFDTAHLKNKFAFLLWPSLKTILGVYGTTYLLINTTLQTWFGNEIFEQIDSIYKNRKLETLDIQNVWKKYLEHFQFMYKRKD